MQWELLATSCDHCLWCNCNKLKLFLSPLDTSEQVLWVRLINDNSSSSNRPQTRDNKWQRHASKQSFIPWFFTNKPDAILHKFETYECHSAPETPPCLSNIPIRPTSSLARLMTWCACFVIVNMLLLPQIRRDAQHRDGTHRGNSTLRSLLVFRIRSCILFLGMHIGSRPRTWDTTRILGLNHGWNRTCVQMLCHPATLFSDNTCWSRICVS